MGLGIQHPAADGRPRYVVDIDPSSRQVVVGAAELLSTRELVATDVITFEELTEGQEIGAQIRAHGEATPGAVTAISTRDLRVRLESPIRDAIGRASGMGRRVG